MDDRFTAPGEKHDWTSLSLADRIDPNDFGSEVPRPSDQENGWLLMGSPPASTQVRTAHVAPAMSIGAKLHPEARVAYDHLFSYATSFLGELPLETIVRFVDGVVTVIDGVDNESEQQRRIEQIMPPYDPKAFRWRGEPMEQQVFTTLKDLANKVLQQKHKRKNSLVIIDDDIPVESSLK